MDKSKGIISCPVLDYKIGWVFLLKAAFNKELDIVCIIKSISERTLYKGREDLHRIPDEKLVCIVRKN